MPHSRNAAGGSIPTYQLEDNRQSSALPASTSEDAEEDTVTAAVTARSTAVTAVAVEAEGPGQSADPEAIRAKVTHRAYRNMRVSVTILKRHQGLEEKHIYSFDVTDPTFEKEIFSELIANEEEDETGVDDEPPPEFQPYDDNPEGPNVHVEEETEVINIGTVEDIKQVRISARLSPQARGESRWTLAKLEPS